MDCHDGPRPVRRSGRWKTYIYRAWDLGRAKPVRAMPQLREVSGEIWNVGGQRVGNPAGVRLGAGRLVQHPWQAADGGLATAHGRDGILNSHLSPRRGRGHCVLTTESTDTCDLTLP